MWKQFCVNIRDINGDCAPRINLDLSLRADMSASMIQHVINYYDVLHVTVIRTRTLYINTKYIAREHLDLLIQL